MPDTIFTGLFENGASLTAGSFLLCMGCALVLGCLLAAVCRLRAGKTAAGAGCSASFVMTLALLPAVVCIVILMVNGNVGAGVAVAGAFSLVRFRSAPGTAREICALFWAMAVGLACGMGFLGFAVLFCLIMAAAWAAFSLFAPGEKDTLCKKELRITIPEDLDYGGVFDDVLTRYTRSFRLLSVKTTNLGSLFKLHYELYLKDAALEKAMIDELRCLNGNLEISCSIYSEATGTL